MTRPLRIELADGYYHVMNRGNNRQDIFLSDKDRKAFMDALAGSCEIYDVNLMAYVLMTNHFHLLVHTARIKERDILYFHLRTDRINL
jgi:putative transposase